MDNLSFNLTNLDSSVLYTNNFLPIEPCVVGLSGVKIVVILIFMLLFNFFLLWFLTRITEYKHKISTNKWLFFVIIRLLVVTIMLNGVLFYYTYIFYK